MTLIGVFPRKVRTARFNHRLFQSSNYGLGSWWVNDRDDRFLEGFEEALEIEVLGSRPGAGTPFSANRFSQAASRHDLLCRRSLILWRDTDGPRRRYKWPKQARLSDNRSAPFC